MLAIDWELLFRYCGHECSAEEHQRFERWLESDPRHRAFYDALVSGATRVPFTPRRGRPHAAWVAALIVAVLGGGLVAGARTGIMGNRSRSAVSPARVVTTRPAERAEVRLPDGTRMVVASASTVRYTVDARTGPRNVVVEGEAYFAVAHDAKRPFTVRARGAVIRDIGTVFDVRAYPDDRRVRVVVADGRIALQAANDSTDARIVEHGQLAHIDDRGVLATRTVDARRYVAWTGGELVFDQTPLTDVARELARWYGSTVLVADTALARRGFTGAFQTESLSDALAIIGHAVQARVEWRRDTAFLAPIPGS